MTESSKNRYIPQDAAEKLIRAHDGDVALLFLYITHTGCTNSERAAAALCKTLAEIDAAAEKLKRMGLYPSESRVIRSSFGTVQGKEGQVSAGDELSKDNAPEYTVSDVAECVKVDSGFAAVRDEAAVIMGRPLNSDELKRLLVIYNYIGLPADVIYLLLHYCSDISQNSDGQGRRPTMNFIQNQAFLWGRLGINDYDNAERYVEEQLSRRTRIGEIKDALDIGTRRLVAAEQRYISSWIDMGFGPDAVNLAYNITVENTGKLAWKYLDRILAGWDSKGLHTYAEVSAYSSSPRTVGDGHRNDFDPSAVEKLLQG